MIVNEKNEIQSITLGERPKRRPRYRGTHPRNFNEKYKELNPKLYPDEIKKVKEAGKTPAGSHRSICVNEIMEVLSPKPRQVAIDATLGYGGHSLELLKRITPGGKLYSFDLDRVELAKTEARIREAGYGEDSFKAYSTNFSHILQNMNHLGIKNVQLLVADLGLSSMQIDNPDRGFSYKVSGPLDMQLDPKGERSAALFLKTVSEKFLTTIIERNSDEEHAAIIAKAIIEYRNKTPIETTDALTAAIQTGLKSLPKHIQRTLDDTPIRRTFQALRIHINDEFRSLELFLEKLPRILAPGGRVAILTFHSGEDRRVKKAFKEGQKSGIYLDVAREVIRPSLDEIYSNPRAKSAKLRWAIRC